VSSSQRTQVTSVNRNDKGPKSCAWSIQSMIDCHSSFGNPFSMLRPRKKYTVYDLQQLKGKQCLTHIHVKSPEEAAAAEEAGVDVMSCSFDSSEAQARLPRLVAAAPKSFL